MTNSREDIEIDEAEKVGVADNAPPPYVQQAISIPSRLASAHVVDSSVLFDASPLSIWILDAETYAFLAVNRAAIMRYGYSEAEFGRMTIRDLCVADDLPLFMEQLSNVSFSNVSFGFDRRTILRHRTKAGGIVFVEPARQETTFGGRRALFSILNDVTERVRAEAALKLANETVQASEARLRAILDNSPSIIYVKDLHGRYLIVNRAFEVLNGRTLEEAKGKTDFEIFPPDLSESIVANDKRVLEAGESVQFEETGPFEDRTLTYISTKFPLRNADGTIYAICGISTNVTEQKREERARQFITEASGALASSLDYEETLRQVTQLAVPHIADWCAVDMLDENGSIKLLALAHVDPEKTRWGQLLRERYPPEPDSPRGVPFVLQTGQSAFYPDISDERLVAGAHDAEHLEILRQVGFRSVMIVPIISRERTLGAITLVATRESGYHYTREDLELAEGLAARAALAIENARLYRAAQEELAERRRIQEALQTSEERFRFSLANSDITVYMQDRDLRYTWAYSGLQSDELRPIYGKTDLDLLIPEDAARLTEIKQRVLQTGIEERHTVRATFSGREPGFYDTVFAPLRDRQGNVAGITGTVHNITERKKAQDALSRHQAEIETLNARLQRSMSETHHRVKNNLQVISALLDMQEMQYESAVPISEISRLSQHIKGLSTIHDLLTYQAKRDAEVHDLSVKEAMDKLVPLIQSMVGSRKIVFSIEDLRMPVRQSTTFTILVNELVSNAIKHGEGEIGLLFFTRGNSAFLQVSDSGPGFPEGFDVEIAANTGLELVQTLAQLDLQGKTRFENREDGGGRVVVEFPIPSTKRTWGEQ